MAVELLDFVKESRKSIGSFPWFYTEQNKERKVLCWGWSHIFKHKALWPRAFQKLTKSWQAMGKINNKEIIQ